jgi:hypothetical protein
MSSSCKGELLKKNQANRWKKRFFSLTGNQLQQRAAEGVAVSATLNVKSARRESTRENALSVTGIIEDAEGGEQAQGTTVTWHLAAADDSALSRWCVLLYYRDWVSRSVVVLHV